MRILFIGSLIALSTSALACETPVCLADPETLALPRIITFEDTRSGHGPGHQIHDVLVMQGAVFGERFAGQSVTSQGKHDKIVGRALQPLTVLPGAAGQNLSVVFFAGNNVLNGYGPTGYPKRDAQGEGSISFLFDEDQSALAFQIRGGEAGQTHAAFLARDGTTLATLDLPLVGEHAYGFVTSNGAANIAGVLITNSDPEGIAVDNIRFGGVPDLS